MATLTYEAASKVAVRGFIILGIVTVCEVLVALLGKGYLIDGFSLPRWIMYGAMISLSLYKAYFIIMYFMHLKYEDGGLKVSLALPIIFVIWGIIAFLHEGHRWYQSKVQDKAGFEIVLPDKAVEPAVDYEVKMQKEHSEHGAKTHAE